MSDNKSIILPTFSGKEQDSQLWWTKFRAFATAKGFVHALLKKDPDLPGTQDEELKDDDAGKKKKKARDTNSLAMAYLLSVVKSQADISITYETMTDEWPGGLAHEVMEMIMEVYKPQDDITEVELYEKLLNVKMKKNEDPKTLFE